jgi:ribosomal-protein-alanine N-acetyltransferase
VLQSVLMELITPRLILRDFRPDDWQTVLAYQRQPQYLRYYAWTDRSPEEVRQFVQMFLDQQQASPRIKFQLAVTLKSTGEVIGNCGIRREKPGDHQAEIGYELDPRFWGRGYATEAARAMLTFGMTRLQLHRVWAHCVADNLGSIRVLSKLGLRQEARLREAEYFKERYWDTLIFAILGNEWRSNQSGLNEIKDP